MKKIYLLGIDAGTTIVKSVIFDLTGNEVAKASQSVSVIRPKPGWAEHDMDEVWRAAALSIRKVIAESNTRVQDIKGVSVSAQGGGIWLVNKEGKPVCNAIGWLDARASSFIDKWQKDGTSERLHEASGFIYAPGWGPCTIFPWFIENNPRVLEESKSVMWCKDWVRYCLTGDILTDETDPLGMLEPQSRRYSREVVRLTGISDFSHLLPPIKLSHEIGGKVTKRAAQETGLAAGTPVAVGAWDVSSTALGAGCVQTDDAASIIGTAGIHVVVTDHPAVNKSYSLSCHAVPGKWLINSMAMTGASNLNWFEKEFCLAERLDAEKKKVSKYNVINQKVANIPVGSSGVIFLPFLQGERAPFVEPRARGEFFGLGDWSTRAELLRAVYEGVALAALHNYRAIEKGAQFDEVRLGGGGSQSEVWAQIIADCTGKVMKVPTGMEFGARGAVINAAVALGIYKNHAEAVKEMVQTKRVHQPNSKNTQLYREIFKIYIQLIESHERLWVEMHKLVEEKLKTRISI